MIDIKLIYQAVLFVNAEDILPTPDIITSFLQIFRDENLIPNTFQELNPTTPKPQVRLRLSTPNNEWAITFATNRIDVTKNPTDPKGSNRGTPDDFCSDAIGFFTKIGNQFPKKANRLALVTNQLLEEMTEEKLSSVYIKLFNSPRFYKDNPPYEWNWRSVSEIPVQISDLKDNHNAITIINRVQGDMTYPQGITVFDRLQLSLDINTSRKKTESRFDITHIKDYFQQVHKIHESLSSQIMEYIDG